MENLLEYPAKELLKKFGLGSHKPGSGSAAALHGLLSAQLLRTVISLTNEVKRRYLYEERLPELLKIDAVIEQRIYPELEKLFQEDSVQFGKAINARNERDEEKDPVRKSELADEALDELEIATEIPIIIAKLCIEIAEFAVIIFDNGFQAARGDSSVALNGAVSSLNGCLAIINLNLTSFGSDEWTEKIRAEADLLKFSYNKLYAETTIRQDILKQEAEEIRLFYAELNSLLSGIPSESSLKNSDIENLATGLQRTLWIHRDMIWKNKVSENPIDVLKPEMALKKLNYRFARLMTLGEHNVEGERFEIAGIIDKPKKLVVISEQFLPETQNFTAAHELGHALLHRQGVLHRDRALDGSRISSPRNREEYQADKFASFFLMPKKQVKEIFMRIFSMERLVINEETATALTLSTETIRKEYKNLRDFSQFIASLGYFNLQSFIPIARRFHVSDIAMAIRLEELDLIEY